MPTRSRCAFKFICGGKDDGSYPRAKQRRCARFGDEDVALSLDPSAACDIREAEHPRLGGRRQVHPPPALGVRGGDMRLSSRREQLNLGLRRGQAFQPHLVSNTGRRQYRGRAHIAGFGRSLTTVCGLFGPRRGAASAKRRRSEGCDH